MNDMKCAGKHSFSYPPGDGANPELCMVKCKAPPPKPIQVRGLVSTKLHLPSLHNRLHQGWRHKAQTVLQNGLYGDLTGPVSFGFSNQKMLFVLNSFHV